MRTIDIVADIDPDDINDVNDLIDSVIDALEDLGLHNIAVSIPQEPTDSLGISIL